MHFGLFKCKIEVSPPTGLGGGGGPYPPSMIHNPARGTPTRGHINYHTPRDPRVMGTKFVSITLKMGEKTFEKIYALDDYQADRLVKVVEVINKAKQRISVVLNNVKTSYRKPDDK